MESGGSPLDTARRTAPIAGRLDPRLEVLVVTGRWKYILEYGDQRFELENRPMTAGRSRKGDIAVADASVSRRHATLTADEGMILLEDLGSSNGTFINGERLQGAGQLRNGDTLGLGDAELRVYVIAVSGLETVRMPAGGVPTEMGEATSLLQAESVKLAMGAIDDEDASASQGLAAPTPPAPTPSAPAASEPTPPAPGPPVTPPVASGPPGEGAVDGPMATTRLDPALLANMAEANPLQTTRIETQPPAAQDPLQTSRFDVSSLEEANPLQTARFDPTALKMPEAPPAPATDVPEVQAAVETAPSFTPPAPSTDLPEVQPAMETAPSFTPPAPEPSPPAPAGLPEVEDENPDGFQWSLDESVASPFQVQPPADLVPEGVDTVPPEAEALGEAAVAGVAETPSFEAPPVAPSLDPPVQDAPAMESPSFDTPAFEPSAPAPTFEAPSFDAPAPGLGTDAPAVEAPSFDGPALDAADSASSFEAPSFETPSFDSGSAAPSFETPSFDSGSEMPSFDSGPETPSFETPSFGSAPADALEEPSPSLAAPTFEAPSTEAPTFEAPTFEASSPPPPSFETPSFETPGAAPSFETPSFETPGAAPSSFAPPDPPATEAPSFQPQAGASQSGAGSGSLPGPGAAVSFGDPAPPAPSVAGAPSPSAAAPSTPRRVEGLPLEVPVPDSAVPDVRDLAAPSTFGDETDFGSELLSSLEGFDTTLGPGVDLPASMQRAKETMEQVRETEPEVAPVTNPYVQPSGGTGAPVSQATASFGKRFLALLVDGIWIGGLAVGGLSAAGQIGQEPYLMAAVGASLGALLMVVGWSLWGSSPGKKLFGLVITNSGGKRAIGFPAALVRLLGYGVGTMLLGLGFLMALRSSGLALHDELARTRVVSA